MGTPAPLGDVPRPPRATRRRALLIAARSFGGLALFIVVAAVFAWWLLGRETTLQRIVVEAEKRMDGQLHIEGVSGSIYDRVAFDRLVFRSKTQVVTVEHGSLRYRLEPFARRFSIAEARAAKLTIQQIARSTEPVVEPDTLALPATMGISTLRIESLHVDALEFIDGESKVALSAVELRGRYATEGLVRRWTIDRLALTTPWGNASGSGRIDATKPFALRARLQAEGRIDDIPYNAPVDVAGRLGDLTATSDFTVSDPTDAPLVGHADAHVLPFRDQPLAAANLRVADLMPKRWKAGLPDAAITVDAVIRPRPGVTAGAGHGATGQAFIGTLHAVNARPGALDRDRIPVSGLDAEVHGDSRGLVIDSLRADLGAAGRVTGKGACVFADGGAPSFDGNVAALDLHAIDGRLIPSRFAGPIAVSRRAGVTRLETELSDTGRRVRIHGELAGDEVRLAEADVSVGGSRLRASGKIDLAKDRLFEVAGTASHLDPHDFGDFARADLNATFKLAGSLGAASARMRVVAVRADVRVDPSRVLDRPLVGTIAGRVEGAIDASPRQGQAAFSLRAVDAAHVALSVGANRVAADGDFGRLKDQLSWAVDAPKLADLAIGLSGRLTGSGTIGGTLNDPSLVFTVAGDDLRYALPAPDATTATSAATKTPANAKAVSAAKVATNAYSVKSIRGNGRLLTGSGGTVATEIALTGFRDGSGAKPATVQAARLQVDGTRDAHRLMLSASSDHFDFTGTASGGLDENRVWRGRVERLANRGKVPLTLSAATDVVVARGRVELGTADVQFDQGVLHLDRFNIVDGRVDTAGRATGFPLTLVGAFSRDFAARVSTSLKFGAEWDLRAGDAIDGKLRIFRESGNVTFLAAPRFDVDPDRLEVDATIVADRLSATIAGTGRGLGRIDAVLATRLSKRDGQWGVAGEAPFELKSDVDVPDVRWLARLSGVSGHDVTGALKLAVSGRGTVARPLLAGRASGDAIALRWPDQGLDARGGHLDLDFDGDRVILEQATLMAGKGQLAASGELRLADRDASGVLNVKFDQFEAVSRTDRTMVVSGSGALKFGATGIDVTADVKADRGSLQLAQRRGPALSTDVVIMGRDDDAAEVPARNVPVRFDVKFDMGDDFEVKGSGFDGKLGGTIRIAGTGADLRAIGTVAVREGTYEGYGQQLTIDRGNLNFSGPIGNPSLDIYAVRKNLAVEAGIQVTGTALAPQAKLVSTPNVPDTEKLSWLVLGHGLAASNKADYGQLATAAAGLLGTSDSTSIQSRIAATLGVDEIGVSGFGGDKGGLLTVGKQISSRLRVSLEQGFTHAATLVKLRYNVYKQIDLQVGTGTESSIDVFYTFSFD